MIDKRMMYSQGQRVAKSLDGSRPGYRGSSYGPPSRSSSQGPAGGASSRGNYGGNRQVDSNFQSSSNKTLGGTPDKKPNSPHIDNSGMTKEQYRGSTDYITSTKPGRFKESQRGYMLGVNPFDPDRFKEYRPEVKFEIPGPFSFLTKMINPDGPGLTQGVSNYLASVNRPFFVDDVIRAGKYKNLNRYTVDQMTHDEVEAAYKEYNRARLNNEIDAYGNPIVTFGKDQGDYSDSGLPSLANYNMFNNQNQNNQNASGLFSSRFLQNQPEDIRKNIEASMQNYYTV